MATGGRTARLTWNICSSTSRLGFSRSIRMTSGSTAKICAKRLCISLMWTTPVKPASRNPSSRMAARIGLSSTMTIFGDGSAPIDHSRSGKNIHSTPQAGIKPCNYGQLGLAPAHQSGRSNMQQAAAPKVSFVSLGCPKALVDSERIITRLRAEGYELARKHDGADLVIVNTCGFLDSAKQESLGAIGEAMAENGKVIVTGCMGAEPEQIEAAYPGVLSITGPQQYESVLDAVHRALPPVHNPHFDLVQPQGIKLTPRPYAYLKISEGCNNRCSFSIIPKLRGDLVSRSANDVLREAERLVAAGVRELLVISQDTSAYGVDLRYEASPWKDREVRAKFVDLAKELGELGAWVRLQYVYPYPHVDEVVPLLV